MTGIANLKQGRHFSFLSVLYLHKSKTWCSCLCDPSQVFSVFQDNGNQVMATLAEHPTGKQCNFSHFLPSLEGVGSRGITVTRNNPRCSQYSVMVTCTRCCAKAWTVHFWRKVNASTWKAVPRISAGPFSSLCCVAFMKEPCTPPSLLVSSPPSDHSSFLIFPGLQMFAFNREFPFLSLRKSKSTGEYTGFPFHYS